MNRKLIFLEVSGFVDKESETIKFCVSAYNKGLTGENDSKQSDEDSQQSIGRSLYGEAIRGDVGIRTAMGMKITSLSPRVTLSDRSTSSTL